MLKEFRGFGFRGVWGQGLIRGLWLGFRGVAVQGFGGLGASGFGV